MLFHSFTPAGSITRRLEVYVNKNENKKNKKYPVQYPKPKPYPKQKREKKWVCKLEGKK